MKYLIPLALIALATPAAAQGQMSPQSCYGSTQQPWVANRWNNGVIPCFRDNNRQACFNALGNASDHCAVQISLQIARIANNTRDPQAYILAESVAKRAPNEPDAWIIMGMVGYMPNGLTDEEKGHHRLKELRTIVATLNRLSLSPAQAGQRDALAQRADALEASMAKARTDAEARVAALDQQAAASAKKACGWTCSDQDRQYHQWCYREGIKNSAPQAQTDHWCSCSLKYYKSTLSANKLAVLIQRLTGPRAAPQGGGLAGFEKGMNQALGDMDLMTYAIQAQNSCSR